MDDHQLFLHAAATGDVRGIETAYLKNKTSLTAKDPTGLTALHLAARHGHVNVLGQLLQYDFPLCITNNQGQTALHIAAQASSAEMVEGLLKGGANCSAKDHDGNSPIIFAYQNPCLDVLNCFLKCTPICGTGCTLTPEVVLKAGSSKNLLPTITFLSPIKYRGAIVSSFVKILGYFSHHTASSLYEGQSAYPIVGPLASDNFGYDII
ncbi:hypothetical protein FE257_008924 [Aspergillus nanangensis]|uniref:Uncharacterized protein n=1 Tax=Aspergillus nanangensis TaxID=2582783 RepID=A0AAD4GZS0_ASPNN|nr:hypothetical protein FE257_008924 [Aspergillus nanangensis]